VNLLQNLQKLENNPRKDADSVIILALRCWQVYRFLEAAPEMWVYLQRANHAVIAAHRKNLVHTGLYSAAIFIAIETRHYDSANEMLDKAMSYKSFLRNNEPLFYGTLCFLYACLEFNQRRVRSAKKHHRALVDHIKNAPLSPHYNVMQGLLHLAANEFAQAYKFLTDALNEGVRSVFLYEGLFRYYKNAAGGFEGVSILPVLIYAAERGAEIGAIAAKYPETLSAAIKADPSAGERLYALSKYPPLLKEICARRISENDMSAEAFAYYRDAEKKQIYISGLFAALIRAAYENNAQKLNHYPIKNFLEGYDISDLGFAVYIYHFLLTDPALSDLLPEEQSKILQLGTKCLENNIRGREVNSIYCFLWSRFRELGISGTPLDEVEEILRSHLTLFEMHTPENVHFVYITEPEKRGMAVYEITEPVTVIEAVCSDVRFTCLGAGQRAVLNEEITIKPMVGGTPQLYMHFFKKGDRRFNLLAYLANHFLPQESDSSEAVPVFEALLEEKTISKPFRMRILAALGRLYYRAEDFGKALECYAMVDEDAIGNDFVGQILNVYLQTREYARATKLISAKYKYISNEFLFEAIEALLEKEEDIADLAETGYGLLMNNFFSESLLDFVLNSYRASYSEWANLSQITDEENRTAPNLDKKVLETALSMACFDQHSQKAFSRIYSEKSNQNTEIINEFTELATFEMFANQARPSYDVLNILEKIFIESERPVLLAWGLASAYLRYNITTFKSGEIISFAISALENEGILFPVFKENSQTPFIEKFQPFLYKSLPEKNCRLYYRIDNTEFSSVPMQYVRYGMYAAIVPMFYNESITYYFSEECPTGSITTKEQSLKFTKPFIHESEDSYFTINNAIIYEQMFKHDRVEKLISVLVKDIQPVRAKLL
jgi:hypothetical protein